MTAFFASLGPVFCVFMAAFLQSVTGFGLVVVAAPLLMFFYDAHLTIILMLMLASCGNTLQSVLLRKDANYRLIGELLVGSLLGQPLGLYIHGLFPGEMLKIFVSVAVICSLLLMQMSKIKLAQCRRNTILCGFLSGVMALTTGMAGPPLAMYFAYTAMEPREQRASFVSFFCVSNICSVIAFLLGGADLTPALQEFKFLLPALFVGIACGYMSFKYVPAQLFRKLIFGILYLACFYTIGRVLID